MPSQAGPIIYRGVRELGNALGNVPTELRRQLRPKIRRAGQQMVDDMRARASYSSRIPAAIRLGTSFSSQNGGVMIRTDAIKAPHARVLELGNFGRRAGAFRHPLFGDPDTWVQQPTRPFFFPAVVAGREVLRKRIEEAVQAAQREVK